MADDKDRLLGIHLPHRTWLGAVGFSALIILMVAVGSTNQLGILTAIILGAVFSAAGIFLWMFPGSRFFVLAFANSLAIYTTVYFFLASANFPGARQWVTGVGYLIPIYLFLFGVWWHREAIREGSQSENFRKAHFPGRLFIWLLPLGVLAALTFFVPGFDLETRSADIVLLGAMGLIGLLVLFFSRQICLFLVDTGTVFDHLFVQMTRLFRPAFAFFTLYSFIVIVFAMIFRIMDRASAEHIFLIDGEAAAISFTESLYFSLITMSTVGYGDVTPAGEAVRVVAAIEIMLGILLFLFGFSEIMRYARDPDADEKRPDDGEEAKESPDED
ncbi:MAG: two pore domain potassium channel family protein [Alphaproteobacteria bacterium]|nr:two pore domain potassium channel family protein [Alphaproteobacteria bacterium]